MWENWSVRLLRIFMYQGSWKFKKTEAYDFWEFSCTGGHENSRILKCMIFVKFHVLGVMKIWENWSVRLLRILMYPGSWKFDKIEESYFWEFSCTRGHENSRKLKGLIFVKFHVSGVMKMKENWSVRLLRNFMYWGVMKIQQNWSVFIFVKCHVSGVMKMRENWSIWFLRISMYPGSWKCEKTEAFDFWEF